MQANERAARVGGISRVFHCERARHAAPHHERWVAGGRP